VIDGQICFHRKEVFNVYEMFHTRYSLFKQVYSHRASKAVEFMVTDILLLADPVMKISSAVDDPASYVHLTDCLIKQIETSKGNHRACCLSCCFAASP
jgi:HD superfamily phosphohydrolase